MIEAEKRPRRPKEFSVFAAATLDPIPEAATADPGCLWKNFWLVRPDPDVLPVAVGGVPHFRFFDRECPLRMKPEVMRATSQRIYGARLPR
jgi:hypothetical protein